MLLSINPSSSTPIYEQLIAAVHREIAEGSLSAGDKLPSASDLAAGLSLNRNTVLRAYRELAQAGVIELRRGRGATVLISASPERTAVDKVLDELASLARDQGLRLSDLVAGLGVRGVR
ncbi:GntR family transcriptional regulator [Corynebacterium uropygiale]|uniref:GntR family transcriptional regulator n=1 Tax=Corynebacterium uropygiale TaxID=1775911 RepID=A0A9X1QR87_9CORY|nr:GntR family transcriptional regulator [Corynebacterium uropygiale]MCF4006368.1 GntR family transcriptional regulator [Corynebacterium uropygiale]